MWEWLSQHYIELVGAATGLLFLRFEIKQNPLLWPLGLLTSLFYIYIFFESKFYADMGLQVYYVFISIYGWYYWLRGSGNADGKTGVPITRVDKFQMLTYGAITIPIFVLISQILIHFSDSPLPYWDALTTALSITATWMLARKIMEHWMVWIVVNAISLGLYFYKGLYPTTVLFIFYTVLSFNGFVVWRRDFLKQQS
jgi:nicotinamide mononucleotide transporter